MKLFDPSAEGNIIAPMLSVIFALLLTVMLRFLIQFLVKQLSKKYSFLNTAYTHVKFSFFIFVAVSLSWIGLSLTWLSETESWKAWAHLLFIATVISFGFFLIRFVTGLFSYGISRHTGDEVFDRRKRTQLTLLLRLSTALIIVVIVGTILFSFPPVRTIGVSLFASAGILSVVAGLAAQSTLTNLIAGIQLSFSDALRVGDTVVVEGEYGTVGEITLSYVVINIWDDRRLILPCSYFTTQPYEQWTRHSGKIMASVFMDCDWRVPVEKVREKFLATVAAAPEFDGRYANCSVVDARGGYVRIRMVVSCASVDEIASFSRRIHEEIIAWLQQSHPEALPTTRVEIQGSR